MQTHEAPRNRDLRAKLLRLDVSAPGERLPRDTGREAQIILDPGTGASLSARRATLDDDDAQALRGRIHRRGQTGGTGADDGHVELRAGDEFCVKAKAFRDLTVRGLRAYIAVANQHRQRVRGYTLRAQACLHVICCIDVLDLVRHAVAREKRADAHRVALCARTDQDDIAVMLGDHAHAAQDETQQDGLAEIGFGGDQFTERLPCHLNHPRPASGATAQVGAAA